MYLNNRDESEMKTYGRYHIHKLVAEHSITYRIDNKIQKLLSINEVTEIE